MLRSDVFTLSVWDVAPTRARLSSNTGRNLKVHFKLLNSLLFGTEHFVMIRKHLQSLCLMCKICRRRKDVLCSAEIPKIFQKM